MPTDENELKPSVQPVTKKQKHAPTPEALDIEPLSPATESLPLMDLVNECPVYRFKCHDYQYWPKKGNNIIGVFTAKELVASSIAEVPPGPEPMDLSSNSHTLKDAGDLDADMISLNELSQVIENKIPFEKRDGQLHEAPTLISAKEALQDLINSQCIQKGKSHTYKHMEFDPFVTSRLEGMRALLSFYTDTKLSTYHKWKSLHFTLAHHSPQSLHRVSVKSSDCLKTLHKVFTKSLETLHKVLEDSSQSIRRLFTKYPKTLHKVFKDSSKTLWRLFGDSSETLWRLFGDSLETLWRLFGDSLETLWRLFGDSLETLWRLFGDSSETLRRLFGDSSETLQRLCEESSETLQRLFILISRLLQGLLYSMYSYVSSATFSKPPDAPDRLSSFLHILHHSP
ncbi:hypothetical protein FA15DRAFT_710978 [Coprinopsis marcescibilis]|uniref:Uncharacterized protein n=1 Tax=Coprinopsis marcescibilis TaxID=230819 RepID=A0A5C3KB09_COPMA|nr:hypothetical protein FA15DRAFT_710978 [Coprinopsis marcescibilis]